jgi:hypothetical protein
MNKAILFSFHISTSFNISPKDEIYYSSLILHPSSLERLKGVKICQEQNVEISV